MEKKNYRYSGKLSSEIEGKTEGELFEETTNNETSDKKTDKSEEERKQTFPRISNVLSRNLAMPKRESIQLELFPSETEEREIKEIIHSQGVEKPISLTATQTEIVLALEYLLTKNHGASENVRGYLAQMEGGEFYAKGTDFQLYEEEAPKGEGEASGNEKKEKGKKINFLTKRDFLLPLEISLIDLCKILYGETGMKESRRDELYKELKAIAAKDVIKEVKVTRTNLDGETEEIEATSYDSLFIVGKRLKAKSKSNERQMEYDKVKISFGGEFVQKIDTEYSPLQLSFFNVKNQEGKRIRTPLFQMLKTELMRRRRDFVFTGVNKAKEKVEEKYRKITTKLTPEQQATKAKELKEAKENALIYRLSFKYIKSICDTDFESYPSLTTKFYKQLEEAIYGLKKCGLITDGRILRNKKEAVFIYNPDLNEASTKNKSEEEGKE